MARSSLPPGFRFHPTDVELVQYYLKRKILRKKLHIDAIAVVDIYKFSPWDLPAKSYLRTRDLEWYFFCPRDKKHPKGARTNRATENGFWKTTGKDRLISYDSRAVGMKKTLVFHLGRAPQGTRTDWVIHEYRLEDKQLADADIRQDTFVLCRLFEKSGPGPKNGEQYGAPFVEEEWEGDDAGEGQLEFPWVDGASSSRTLPISAVASSVDGAFSSRTLPISAVASSGTDVPPPADLVDDVLPDSDGYSISELLPIQENIDEIEALLVTLLSDNENVCMFFPPEKASSGLEHVADGPLVIEAAPAEFDQDQIFAGLDNPCPLGTLPNYNNDAIAFGMETDLLNLSGAADFELYGPAAEVAQGTVGRPYPMADHAEEVVYPQHTAAAAADNGNNSKQPASSGSCYSSMTNYYCYNP